MFVVDGAAQRILRGTAGSLSWQGRDADGEPADVGTATVTVARSDGNTLIASTAASGTAADPRTIDVTVAQTAQLDALYATWTIGSTEVATTRHDIVGGYYFDAAELRRDEPTLMDTTVGSTGGGPTAADIRRVRTYVETFIEQATGRAFVPRFDVERVRGTAVRHVVLRRPWLRSVRWVKLWSANDLVLTLDADEVAAIPPNASGIVRLERTTASYEIEIGYEHGADGPPEDVAREALVFARRQLNRSRRSTPEEATSLRMQDGGFVTLATPGTGRWHAGIPSVDDMIARYQWKVPGVA